MCPPCTLRPIPVETVYKGVLIPHKGPAPPAESSIVRARAVPSDPSMEPTKDLSATPTTTDDVVRLVAAQGIEFLFAQFVDMHGKPSAKLVPAQPSTTCSTDGAGFAGFAAGDDRADPDRSRPARRSPIPPASRRVPWQPDLARLACDVTVDGEPWPYCPRTILRRQLARRGRARLRAQGRHRGRVLPRARRQTGGSSSPTRSTRARQPCYDMQGAHPQLRRS